MSHFSTSQIKKFMFSKSQRAWTYVLWVKDDYQPNAAFEVGKAFHHYAQTWNLDEAYDIMVKGTGGYKEEDIEKAVLKFENLKDNFDRLGIVLEWENEVRFDKMILWYPFVGYIDKMSDEWIYELKTTSSLSKEDDKPPMWSVINSYEEYKLQCWLYMKAMNRNKAMLIEVLGSNPTIPENTTLSKEAISLYCKDFDINDAKLTKKDIIAKYSPIREYAQVIIFQLTPEFDKEMTDKYEPILKDMWDLLTKFNIQLKSDMLCLD